MVVIMSDQHNPHVMGCAGNTVVRTPNLDALAAEGVRFTSAYCPYPLCVPSRMAFVTARDPDRVRVWDNGCVLASDVPTVAHALGAAGYEAVLCGRMHFCGPDQYHGFERRIYADCQGFLSPEIQGSGYNRTNGQTRYAVEIAGYGRTGFQAYDQAVTERACRFVEERTDPERPYCMVVGYMLPHNPLICERALFEEYLAALPVPDALGADDPAASHPALRKWRARREADVLRPEQQHRALAAYYGLVTELDRNIGRLVDAVRSRSAAEDTLIVYCTDHGDMAGEHGMWWKSCFFEGAAGVPLVVSWPGRFPGGRSVEEVVNLIDVPATVLDLAGAEPVPDMDGRSLVGLLEAGGPVSGWPNETFSQYVGAHGDRPSCMIRSGPWKLMYYPEFDSHLLFNLAEDPGELCDRGSDPACRAIVEGLLAKIHARWSAERMLAGYAEERRVRDETRRRARAAVPDVVCPAPPPPDANQFDFSQVPGWAQIRARVARDAR